MDDHYSVNTASSGSCSEYLQESPSTFSEHLNYGSPIDIHSSLLNHHHHIGSPTESNFKMTSDDSCGSSNSNTKQTNKEIEKDKDTLTITTSVAVSPQSPSITSAIATTTNTSNSNGNTLKNNNSYSSFLESIKNDDKEFILEFCKGNKNINKLEFRDTDGRSPVHYCVEYDSFSCLETMLSIVTPLNEIVNLKDKDDWTPLHYAALFDRIECALHLIQNGANINCLTNESWTPLHVSAWRGHSDFVTMLIEKSARLSLKTKDGLTSHQLALNSSHFSIANQISEALLTKDDGGNNSNSSSSSSNNSNNTNVNSNSNSNNNNNNNNIIEETNSNEEILSLFKRASTDLDKLQLEQGVNYNNIKDSSGITPLHLCALNGLIDTIGLLVEKYNMNVNIQDNSGKTPLHYASYAGRVESMRKLISFGANVNICLLDLSPNILLQQQQQHQQQGSGEKSAGVLFVNNNNNSNNVNLKLKKEYGITPLHEAAYSGELAAVCLLIDHNANMNAKSFYGTALHYAASVGSNECIKYLLQHGADSRLRNEQGMTALHVAAFHGYPEALNTLILSNGGAEVNAKCKDGSTPLLKATMGASGSESKENSLSCISLLLDKGADANIPNDQGETPLHVSCYYGLTDIAQALIGRGSNLEAKDEWAETPLHKCTYQNHHQQVKLLLEMGARVNAENHEGETPLHISVRKNSGECAHILAAWKGVDLNLANKYGETPLHYACSYGLIELAMLFLEKGAIPHLQDSQGDIPLMVSLRKGFTEISLTLIRWGVEVGDNGRGAPRSNSSSSLSISADNRSSHITDVGESPFVSPMLRPNNYNEHALHAAAMAGYSECVLALLGVGADINQFECYGNTPLHAASYTGNSDLVDMMITMGAIVNITNKDHVSPLHVAALAGKHRVVETLISRGGNCNLCDKNGDTPLHGACLSGDPQSVTTILTHGNISIDVKNAKQWTPLHMACASGHIVIVKLLVQMGANPNIKNISGDLPYDTAISSGHFDISTFLKKPKKSYKLF
ncbi:hypothetical protein CYY_000962 [Polysphondylium violaceum]|uniref:Ankyrin repeat-containing protein n=1 Tax=Polysphondylium violaceum TaxID=133409 RepID=A0A8J4V1Z6_9MYCE|nr:hypothetical protein CYY_000962 [Polysphondylium violaceum]